MGAFSNFHTVGLKVVKGAGSCTYNLVMDALLRGTVVPALQCVHTVNHRCASAVSPCFLRQSYQFRRPVVQGLGKPLPVQGTQVRSLLQEDSTWCQKASEPMHQHRCSPALWSLSSETREAAAMRRSLTTSRQPPARCNQRKPTRRRPSAPKI